MAPTKKTPAKKAPAAKKSAAPAKKAAASAQTPAKKAAAPTKAAAPAKKAAAATEAVPVKRVVSPPALAGKVTVKKAPPPRKGPLDKFLLGQVDALNEERVTYVRQAASLKAEADLLAAEREPGDVQFDEESGEGDTLAVERDRDLAAQRPGQRCGRGDRPLAREDQGRHLRRLRAVQRDHPQGAPACPPARCPLRAVQERGLHPSLRTCGEGGCATPSPSPGPRRS